MAKEFDIYLNNRLTECDIIVYSIPYRDGLTVMSQLILESCLDYYLLQKFVAAQTGSELVAHIDKMIKICNEKLSCGVRIDTSAEFSALYSLRTEENNILLTQNDVKMLANSFTGGTSALDLVAEPLLILVGKSPGRGSSEIIIDTEVEKMIKNSIEQFHSGAELTAGISRTSKRSNIAAESGVTTLAELSNLCYRLHIAGNAAYEIAANVLGTEIHFSLGYGENGIVIDSELDGAELVTKYESIVSSLSILSEVIESINQFMEPSAGKVNLLAEVQTMIKRHRLLGEMDDGTLLSFDSMTLEELDFVILSE